MYSAKQIKKMIKDLTEQGICKFIIYPFGDNGYQIKQILKEYFDIDPYMIVDNNWYKYNPNIVSIDRLRKSDINDAYVLLGIEDDFLNKKMYEELAEIFPNQKIINFKALQDDKKSDNEYKKRLEIQEKLKAGTLFPNLNLATMGKGTHKSQKINVIFHIGFASLYWESIKPLYNCFRQDDKYNVIIIPGNTINSTTLNPQEDEKSLLKDNVTIISENDFPENLNPDIVIAAGFSPPLDSCNLSVAKIMGKSKLNIGIYNRLLNYDSYDNLEQALNHGRMLQCDYCVADMPLYREIMKNAADVYRNKYVEFGHPKFDIVFLAMKEKRYLQSWKKLEGKKVVLWAPSHGLYDRTPGWWYTFDIYAKHIIEYVTQHKEFGLIIRLQNLLVWELLQQGIWKYRELDVIKNFCERSENIVFDENVSYMNAYSIMDGVITDRGSSVQHSALPTLKPICITYRNDNVLNKKQGCSNMTELEKFEELLYGARSLEDIDHFFECIISGQDFMFEIRKEKMNDYIKSCDGKNSQRIKQFIEEKFTGMV